MWLYEALADELVGLDGDRLFGVLGDGNLFIVDALEERRPGAYVAMANEASAVQAANGYAQVSGKVGMATVTHGPGLSNVVTPLVEAVRSHTAVLLVAGETATDDPGNLQRLDQRAVVEATGAAFLKPSTATEGLRMLRQAHRMARDSRGPVVLSIPYDLQWQSVDELPTETDAIAVSATEGPAVEQAAAQLATAARPVVLAGRGAVEAGVEEQLSVIARRLGAVTLTSLRGKGLFADEPFHFGVAGGLGDTEAMARLRDSDCVLAVGVGLNPLTTDGGDAIRGHVVRIDDDPALATTNGLLQGNAADVVPRLVSELERLIPQARPAWAKLCPAPPTTPPPPSAVEPLTIVAAVRQIEQAISKDRTLVTDGGRFFFEAARRLSVPSPRAYVHTASYAAIGLGMPAAIGAAIARPQAPVLMVTGDGGFMLGGLTEFRTAVRERLNLTVVVLNDGAYGAEVVQLEAHGRSSDIAQLDWPDLGPVATALGGHGWTVRTSTELAHALEAADNTDGPVLLDVHIDAEDVPWPFHKATPAAPGDARGGVSR